MFGLKTSSFFSRAMLTIFALIMLAGIAAYSPSSLEHKSYLIAYLVSIVLVILLCFTGKSINFKDFNPKASSGKIALLLSLICLAVKLAWVFLFRVEPTVDYLTFWNTAVSLSSGTEFEPTYVALFPHIMGYSWFLSLFLKVFGKSALVPPVVNVCLTVISGICIFCLLNRNYSVKAAYFGYILWIICPSCTLYNTMVLSEPYYTVLLLLYILLADVFSEKIKKSEADMKSIIYVLFFSLVGACLLSLMNTARPIGIIPFIATVIWLLFFSSMMKENKKAFLFSMAAMLILISVYKILGNIWVSYMERILGVKTSTFPGYSLYVGFDMNSMGSYSEEDMSRLQSLAGSFGSFEAQRIMLEEAKSIIQSGNIRFGKLFITKLGTFLGNDEGGAFYSLAFLTDTQYSICAVASNVFYYALVILTLAKMVKWFNNPGSSPILICPLFCIGLTLAQMLVEVAGRYHYSIIPMLIIISAIKPEKLSN